MFDVRIIADSIGSNGVRITTAEVDFWKPLIGEFNTHRVFSRNSASSRAIPAERLRYQLKHNPHVPTFKQAARGMQPGDYVSQRVQQEATEVWLDLRNMALVASENLESLGIAKQWINRLVECWMETTILVTSTDWDNFFNLRCHPAAQDEIRIAAENIRSALANSIPTVLAPGEWHIPYRDKHLIDGHSLSEQIMASVGRCATVSYDNLGSGVDIDKDVTRAVKLLMSGHFSPFEHIAACLPTSIDIDDIEGIPGLTIGLAEARALNSFTRRVRSKVVRSGNFQGWYQFRQIAAYSDYHDLAGKIDLLVNACTK